MTLGSLFVLIFEDAFQACGVSAKQRLCDRRFAVVAETVSACAPLIGFPFRPVYTRVAVCFDFFDCCPQCRFTRLVLKIAVLSAPCPGGARPELPSRARLLGAEPRDRV